MVGFALLILGLSGAVLANFEAPECERFSFQVISIQFHRTQIHVL